MRLRPLVAVTVIVMAGTLAIQPGIAPGKAHAFNYGSLNQIQRRILSGYADSEVNPRSTATLAQSTGAFSSDTDSSQGCPTNIAFNIKVNQNCLNISDPNLQGRAQANNETAIAQDPLQPNHLISGYNDYRRGDGNCYGAYSLDRGRTWTDTTVPMGFTRGNVFGAAREYWQAGGDPAVAWDTKGNAYFQCQVFNRGAPTSPNPDTSSAVYVFRSTGTFGASWNFPGRPVIEYNDVAGTGAVLEDKPYMTVDNHVGSPFQDRIYVTYTEFAADGTAYIWESYSADYGEHFSPRVLVSSTSTLCGNTFGLPTPQGACNENQFSQPFTGSDGALYVVFANFNNVVSGNDNRNQILLVKSTDGGNTFSAPVKVADYYDLPDCLTYQGLDAGRACVPEKGSTADSYFRAANYPSGAVNPLNPGQVAVTFGSYINLNSNEGNGCTPAGFSFTTGNNLYTGVKTPGACNNDILVSASNNGGMTFTGTSTDPRQLTSVTQSSGQATTDQFFQWAAFTSNGTLAVSYFDRRYGADETTGNSDVSLSGSSDLVHFRTLRATSSSMPPPTEFAGTFYGDYTGLAAATEAHPLWMDTRNPDLFLCPGTGAPGTPPQICTMTAPNGILANDQDIYTVTLPVPHGGENG